MVALTGRRKGARPEGGRLALRGARQPRQPRAHLVIDGWGEQNKTFWASDQPGGVEGPRCLLYKITQAPDPGASMSANYVRKARLASSSDDADDRLYYITRPMQTH